jgi:hypothetical protein
MPIEKDKIYSLDEMVKIVQRDEHDKRYEIEGNSWMVCLVVKDGNGYRYDSQYGGRYNLGIAMTSRQLFRRLKKDFMSLFRFKLKII